MIECNRCKKHFVNIGSFIVHLGLEHNGEKVEDELN